MYSPALQGLLAQAKAEEIHRAVLTNNGGRDVTRPPAAPLSRFIKRAFNRLFAGRAAVNDETLPVRRRFDVVGHGSPASLRPHS